MQGLRDCVAEKGLIPCVGCLRGQASYGVGVLGYVGAQQLSNCLLQLLNGLINPTWLAWLCVLCIRAMCKPASSLIPWRIMPSSGVVAMLRD